MKGRTLHLAWTNEELTASWWSPSGATERWTAPFPVKDRTALSAAIGEARKRAGSRATRAACAIDHRHLLFHVQETPPARGILLDRMLDRLVAESRFFEEPAVWARSALPPDGKRNRWLLALLPRSVLDDIEVACEENDLESVSVRPAVATLAGPLKRLGADPAEAILLVADFGGSYGLLAGRGDGQILFARSIAGARGETEGRLDQEINRTLQFVLQRFGGRVDRMVVVGPKTSTELAGRRIREGLRIECLMADSDDAVTVAPRIGAGDSAPLDFRRGRRSPTWVRPALAAGLAALLIVSSAAAALSVGDWKARESRREGARREARALVRIAAARNARHNEVNRLQALVESVGRASDVAMIPAFGRYVPTVLPPTFRLTGLALERSTNGWTARIRGVARDQGSRFLSRVESWERELAGGPFRLEILDSTHRRSVKAELPSETSAFGGAPPPTHPRSDEQPFFVTGLIP